MSLLSIKREVRLPYSCEKCSAKENLQTQKIFGLYNTTLCSKCWRDWEAFIRDDPDFKLFDAINKYWHRYETTDKEKKELVLLSTDATLELKPVLENWIGEK